MTDPSAVVSTAAAEFFKNKNKNKKGKKVFSFNANLIDADSISQHTVHIDAPALSSNNNAEASETSTARPLIITSQEKVTDDANSEWDDTAVISIGGIAPSVLVPPTNNEAGAAATATAELGTLSSTGTNSGGIGNIGTLSTNEYYDDSTIAEKLRVEETRAQLAAARIGMERQAAAAAAAAAQAEKEKQEKAAKTNSISNTGGRWVPAHLRNQTTTTTTSTTSRFGGPASQKFDVASTELFPDLHTAVDKIEKEKQQQQKQKIKVAPVAKKSNAMSFASVATTSSKVNGTSDETEKASAPVTNQGTATASVAETPTSKVDEATTESNETTATQSEAEARATSTDVSTAPIVKKTTTIKKKKKDLSTFKASS